MTILDATHVVLRCLSGETEILRRPRQYKNSLLGGNIGINKIPLSVKFGDFIYE